jgi:hypothetical protein
MAGKRKAEHSDKPAEKTYSEKEPQDKLRKYMDRDVKQEQEIAELKLRLKNMKGANTEEDLRQKVEELNNIKDAYQKKMKNTVALQKLKYETEIKALKRDYKEKIRSQKAHYEEELKKYKRELKELEENLDNSF